MSAVANTSPVILLAKVGKLDLVSVLYGEVVIPPAVAAELRAKPDAVSQELEHFLQSLVEAKARRCISTIAPLLDRLVAEGLWLSEKMRQAILDAVGE